jgi:hypothetical protein
VKALLQEAQQLVSAARSASSAEHTVMMQPEPFMQFTLFRMLVQFEQKLHIEAGNTFHVNCAVAVLNAVCAE